MATKVYARRLWVLTLYSLFAFLQGWLWGVPGPMSDSFAAVYGIDGTVVQFLLNWGPIGYIVACVPFAYWLDRPGGLRGSTIASMWLVTLGAALRCILFDASPASVVLQHASAVSVALAGPVAMAGVSILAERWFPPGERGLATAIASEANILGNVASFLVGPTLVAASDDVTGMRRNSYLSLGCACVLQVAMLAYFPSAPPLPPSRSAHASVASSTHFTLGTLRRTLGRLVANSNFVVLCAAYGLANGMSSGWSSTLNINLSVLGYDQSTAGWIGCAGVLAGNAAGLLAGRCADRRAGRKAILVWCTALAGAAAVWFALIVQGALPGVEGTPGLVQVFLSATLIQLFINATVPIFFELSMEATFPLSEGTVLMTMTTINNIGGMIVLFIPIQTAAGPFNWTFAGEGGGVGGCLRA